MKKMPTFATTSAKAARCGWLPKLALIMILVGLSADRISGQPSGGAMAENEPRDLSGIIGWATFTKVFNKSYSTLTQQLVRHKLFTVKQLRVFITASKWRLKMAPNYLVINKFSDLAPHEETRLLSGNLDEPSASSEASHDENGSEQLMDDGQVAELLRAELAQNPYGEQPELVRSSAMPRSRRQKRDLNLLVHETPTGPSIRPPMGLLDVADLVRLPRNEHLLVRAQLPRLKWWVPAENPFYEPVVLPPRSTSDIKRKPIEDIPEDKLAGIDEFATKWLRNYKPGLKGLTDLGRPSYNLVTRTLAVSDFSTISGLSSPVQRVQKRPEILGTSPSESKIDVVHKDWRETGCIAPPYDQGSCCSCYAISSMAFLEWAYCMSRNRALTPLSAQYLISCGPQFMRESGSELKLELHGCNKGRSRQAMQFIKEYGAELEAHMPYMAEDSVCPLKPHTPTKYKGYLRPNVRSSIRMASNTKQLETALKVGPVIANFREPVDFLAFGGGLVQNCHQRAGHAMLIVGHGVENNTPYLLIKNSFGTDWGEGGYFKFDRNFTQECVKDFVLPRVSFPSKKSQMRRMRFYDSLKSEANQQVVEPGNFETHIEKLSESE